MPIDGGGAFSFQFAPAAAVQQDMATIQTQIDQAIATLDQYSNQQLNYWTSTARATYDVAKAKWDTAAQEMSQILQRMHVGLGNIHDNFRTTENFVTGLW